MKGKIELYNISFLILKVELHFKAMKYAFLNFLYLQILQLWILIMFKLSLTLMNMKSGVTQLSILLLETAASKMRNRNVCKTRAHMIDHE